MDTTPDPPRGDCAGDGEARATDVACAGRGAKASLAAPRVLVVDADCALLELLEEWLAAYGCDVVAAPAGGKAALRDVDLVVVDVPFPRQGGLELLRRIAGDHPGTPIVALSSNFFPGIASGGAVAQALGVARVLPVPVARDALVTAVRQLLPVAP